MNDRNREIREEDLLVVPVGGVVEVKLRGHLVIKVKAEDLKKTEEDAKRFSHIRVKLLDE